MIVSALHLFKVYRKIISGNTSIIVENMLGKTPKSFNSINVIICSLIHQLFGVIYRMVLSQSFEKVVTFKSICYSIPILFLFFWIISKRSSLLTLTCSTTLVHTLPSISKSPNTIFFLLALLPHFPFRFPPKYDSSSQEHERVDRQVVSNRFPL